MALNISRSSPFNDTTPLDSQQAGDSPSGELEMAKRLVRSRFLAAPRIRMDVTETEKAYTVKAEIPGARKENIKIAINGNQVSISAETQNDTHEERGEALVRSERYYGRRYRSFAFASDVDDAKADARYQDGVLELILPKKKAVAPRNVVVN